jgi:predicted secreted acid phosphatase
MMLHRIALAMRLAAAVGLIVLGAGCTAVGALAPSSTASIPSLADAKRQVAEYVDSGRYAADIAETVRQARDYLTARPARGGKLAIVLDIDETALSNVPALRANDYGFIVAGPCADLPRGPCGFLAWINLARAEPIRPVLELARFARAQGIAVFFLTGRPERVRAATEANLRAAGYEWTAVLLKPDALNTPSAVDFKALERKKLTEQGYLIVVNVGDQMSDLEGDHAERMYKLPNPFYFVP